MASRRPRLITLLVLLVSCHVDVVSAGKLSCRRRRRRRKSSDNDTSAMVLELQKQPTTAAPSPPPQPPAMALLPLFTKWSRNLSCLLATSLVSVLFVLTFSSSFTSRSATPVTSTTTSPQISLLSFSSLPPPPSLAYLITGTDGDYDRVLRLLFSIYHPKNHYLLHLDLDAKQEERDRLAIAVQEVHVFRKIGNVHVVGKAGFANTRGSSALAVVLHGAALLLRLEREWDWFVNLDVSDYPLVTQDDLLHILAFLPRDLNFIQHTSHFEPKELRRLKPVIVDPTLVFSAKTDVYYGTQRRQMPTSFHLFTGSPSLFLSRKFIEYSILGRDNFPRTLLMYFANAPSSHTKYFHTLLCNTVEFKRTVYNGNFHFVLGDATHEDDPSAVGVKIENMTQSGAAFGSGFSKNDALLNLIDQELLNRLPGSITQGGWCLGIKDPCAVLGDANILRPGPGAKSFEKMIVKFLSDGDFHTNQCILE